LKAIWKNKLVSNCTSSISARVAILFNKKIEIIDRYTDLGGRHLIVLY
jgi:hypothetical protein